MSRPESAPSIAGRRVVLGWLGVVLCFVGGGVVPQATDAHNRDEIRALIARAELPQLKRPDFTTFRQTLDTFYGTHGYDARWLAPDAPWRAGLGELAAAPAHGLDASDYDLDWLRGEFNAIAAGDRASERVARADVVLTVSVFRFLSDLHRGRVPPARAGFKFNSGDKPLDLATLLGASLARGKLHDAVIAAEPTFTLHRSLEEALARYRALAAAPLPPLPELPKGTRKIEPGGIYAGVAALAERLRRVGDLPASAPAPDDTRYGGVLVDAIRAFQDRHGLHPDGVLGRETFVALATPLDVRVRQIELSLERLRWLPDMPAGPLIAVNIPSFRLWAFANSHEDSAATLSMAVIVGRAVSTRKTPVFIGEMRYVEFSPYWNVPQPIQRDEIVPRLARDPGYWEHEELEAVPISGKGAAITTLDAGTLTGLETGALRLRQRPGTRNALGGVKFVMPNSMDIYLHGTPALQLFGEARRDFSHGCIRVADPPALAAIVLRDQPQWTPERIEAAMAAGKTSTVWLKRSIPVVIFYTTAIVDSTGRVLFQSDIYGYDRKLESALNVR